MHLYNKRDSNEFKFSFYFFRAYKTFFISRHFYLSPVRHFPIARHKYRRLRHLFFNSDYKYKYKQTKSNTKWKYINKNIFVNTNKIHIVRKYTSYYSLIYICALKTIIGTHSCILKLLLANCHITFFATRSLYSMDSRFQYRVCTVKISLNKN